MYRKLLCLLELISISFYPVTAFSECSKEDIQFYLDKGFTQEQITQLCSAAKSEEAVPNYTPYQQKIIIYQEGEAPGIKDGFTKEEREAIKVLQAGGDVIKLRVDQQSIKYTSKVCIQSGNTPVVEQRYKTCPEVAFVIKRDGLKATSSGKKQIVFGRGVVTLEGVIDRKLKGSWDNYPVNVRNQLERNFNWKENGHLTDFPVRGDYSITNVVNAIRTLSTVDHDQFFDDEPEDEKEVDQTLAEKNTVNKEKKKHWWNPFD